jgi:hypothetical protein
MSSSMMLAILTNTILGAMMYDPCIGQYDLAQQQLPVVPFVKANNQHFRFDKEPLDELEKIYGTCGYKAHFDKYFAFPPTGVQPRLNRVSTCSPFQRVQLYLRNTNACFNVYEVSQRCKYSRESVTLLFDYFSFPFNLLDAKFRYVFAKHLSPE